MARFENADLEDTIAELKASPDRAAEGHAVEHVLEIFDLAADLATCITNKPHTDFIVQVYDRIDRELQRRKGNG